MDGFSQVIHPVGSITGNKTIKNIEKVGAASFLPVTELFPSIVPKSVKPILAPLAAKDDADKKTRARARRRNALILQANQEDQETLG